MGEAQVERFQKDVSGAELVAALERDGGAIVEGAMQPSQLEGLNRDLDTLILSKPPGVRQWEAEVNPPPAERDKRNYSEEIETLRDASRADVDEFAREFYGSDTVRIDGLPGKSENFVDLMCSPLLLDAADRFLLPNCVHYTLSTGQLIEIRPGETPQSLHRDCDAWIHYQEGRPELTVEAMFALTDFTERNGATRIVPGSHRWEDNARQPEAHEIVVAEMPAGSAVIYLGSTIHGGGANLTESDRRRGMFLGYCLGWLRTEENTYLTTPIEAVRGMPRRAQELLGYESHLGIGVVDVGSPMKLLQRAG